MLRLVALLLLAGLVSAVRPDVQERLGGEIQYVCEGYTAEQCKDLKLAHCRLCTRVDGLALCFDPQVSAQLSPHVFKCMDPSAAASAAAAAAGTVQCEKLSPEECKEHASECALCASPLKPAKCYQPEEARKLPALIFKCQIPGAVAE